MIDWHEVAHTDAIRRIGEILRRQFNIWVGFLGPSGLSATIGAQQPVDKTLCDAFKSRSDSLSCQISLRQWFDAFRREEIPPEGAMRVQCHGSLSAMLVPILVRGQVVGLCFASGFLVDGDEEDTEQNVFRRSQELGLNRSPIAQGFRDLPRLGSREVRVCQELLHAIVDLALKELGEERQPPEAATSRSAAPRRYSEIIGNSVAMLRLFRLLDKVVESESTVMIHGDPGVGKELVARAVHFNSVRRHEQFVVQNCSALNDSLLDSELFGHKRGAFTGAIGDKQGLFEIADRGTFFLDEIGDMSPMLQVKLLRVLQEGTFVPVGDTVVRKVDVRIIAATNKDLKKLVKERKFRSDLYYRINVISVHVPPLRERLDDVPLLLERFLEVKCSENNCPRRELSKAARERLVSYHWPGNVRELENEIERLIVLADEEGAIPEDLLSPRILRSARGSLAPAMTLSPGLSKSLPEALESLERHMILESLKSTGWNKTRTAKELGISRRNLIRKVDRYQLDELRPEPRKKR